MVNYKGPQADDPFPLRGGRYNPNRPEEKPAKVGSELYNFSPFEGRVYGYFQPPGRGGRDEIGLHLDKLGATRGAKEINDVTVIWTALRGKGDVVVVGWYESARVMKFRTHRPEGGPWTGGPSPYSNFYYCSTAEADAHLIHEEDRFSGVQRGKGGLGRNFRYGTTSQGGIRDRWVSGILRQIATIRAGARAPPAPGSTPATMQPPRRRRQLGGSTKETPGSTGTTSDAWAGMDWHALVRADFHDEFNGNVVYDREAHSVRYQRIHGSVTSSLEKALRLEGWLVTSSVHFDLYSRDRATGESYLFEVKTNPSRSSQYSALGQLTFYREMFRAEDQPRSIAVIPGPMDRVARRAFTNQRIGLLDYTIDGSNRVDFAWDRLTRPWDRPARAALPRIPVKTA
ncbi:MAG: hypothetical protein L3K01_02890 [Thermoplasmata archaeon]|nr:hypothetical protein [Thermoplasmata archaeon]